MKSFYFSVRNAIPSDNSSILKIGIKAYENNPFYSNFCEKEVDYYLNNHPSLCFVALNFYGEIIAFALGKESHPLLPDYGHISWAAKTYGAGGAGLDLAKCIREVLYTEFGKTRCIIDVEVHNKVVLNRALKEPDAQILATYHLISVANLW